MRLTEDDRDLLNDIVSNKESVRALQHLLEDLVEAEEQAVLSTRLDDSGNNHRLILAKARAEGARKLLVTFKATIEARRAKKS